MEKFQFSVMMWHLAGGLLSAAARRGARWEREDGLLKAKPSLMLTSYKAKFKFEGGMFGMC